MGVDALIRKILGFVAGTGHYNSSVKWTLFKVSR